MKIFYAKGSKRLVYDENSIPDVLSHFLTRTELSIDEVIGLSVDSIIAGVDTTSKSLQWILYFIASSPHVHSFTSDR
jgi:cytochrome P450